MFKSIFSLFLTLTLCVTALAGEGNTDPANPKGLSFDGNVPAKIKEQMLKDLEFMNTLKGSKQTALHLEIFKALDGKAYKEFFETRVYSIGKNSCGGGNAVACVYSSIANKMFITDHYINFSHPEIARLMVVYHEARHTERQNGSWSHATCPTPFVDANGQEILSLWTGAVLAGEPACDITPKGSYGSSTILLKNVAMFCENCSEKVKMDADIYSTDQLKRITNKTALADMLKDFEVAKK